MINISSNSQEKNKQKTLPFHLTNQTVYEMMSQNVFSSQKRKNKSIYPTIRYETTPSINLQTHASFKIAGEFRQKKNHKKCKTMMTNVSHRKQSQKNLSKKQKTLKMRASEGKIDQTTRVESPMKEKFLDRIHKMKSIKLKKYMQNKFAIGVKQLEAINTQSTHSVENIKKNQRTYDSAEKIVPENSFYEPPQILKKQRVSLNKFKKRYIKTKQQTCEYSPAVERLRKELEALNVILNSFACYNPDVNKQIIDFDRHKQKYYFFVGLGNNRGLIRQIMRKRWWWTETNNYEEAHLVWSQVKIEKIFEKMQKQNVSNKKVPYFVLPQSTIKKEGLKLFHQENRNTKKFSLLRNQIKTMEIPTVLHNHYAGNQMLGQKRELFKNLCSYCEYKEINKYDIIPLTFHFSRKNEKQFLRFQKMFAKKKMYWIVKPGEDSNQGKGIFLTKSMLQIKNEFRKTENSTIIVQKYIENIFLFQKRKFDIRTYFLALTINGILKFYWYDEGYLRTSSEIYSLQDCDRLVHLTNDAIQYQSEKYSEYEIGNKVSYHNFQRYLNQIYGQKVYSVANLHNLMKNIAKIAISSIYNKIDPIKSKFCFQLFGLDFIIDHKFKPWLIEINTNPCLQVPSPNLQRLIPQMTQNFFRIAVDSMFPPFMKFPRTMAFFVPDDIFQSNKFELIFDWFFDRDEEWEKHCDKERKHNLGEVEGLIVDDFS